MLDQENQTISFYHILPDELSLWFFFFFFHVTLYSLPLSGEKSLL